MGGEVQIKIFFLLLVPLLIFDSNRLLWFVVVNAAAGGCVYLVTNIWIDWLEETTLTTIAETEFDLWNIFYPGVSFCSNNKVDSDSWAVFEALQRAKFDEVGIESNLR